MVIALWLHQRQKKKQMTNNFLKSKKHEADSTSGFTTVDLTTTDHTTTTIHIDHTTIATTITDHIIDGDAYEVANV